MDSRYGTFSIALEYTRSIRPEQIARFLFGCDVIDCNSLAIQGSEVSNRLEQQAWLADYFGLSPAFDSRVSFCPRIENVIVNFDLYLGIGGATKGLYFRIHSPLTYTRWSLNMCEHIINEGISDDDEIGFPPTYMAAEPETIDPNIIYHGSIEKNLLPQNFTEAICGCATWGDMQSPLQFGRMTCCALTKTTLADIHAVLGWNCVLEPDYHFGINIRTVFPTGNRPCAACLFEPQVGDRKHWQLGAGLTSSWIMWTNEDNEENYLGLYFDANFLHFFKTWQCRSFDFCCKPNSRYMLLAQMGPNDDAVTATTGPVAGDVDGTITNAEYQYQRQLIPAINYTTFNIDVKIAIQADLVIKLGYVRENWSLDLGYNLWARSGEKFSFNGQSCCGCFAKNKYVLKGDALLYGSPENPNPPPPPRYFETPVPLSFSQSEADIHSGQNMKEFTNPDNLQNKGVDNYALAYINTGVALPPALYSEPYTIANLPAPAPAAPQQIYTSIEPKIITYNDINFCRSPSAISHKLFAHIGYTWDDREDNYTPYLGIGCEAEFNGSCDACRFAVSQWGMWLKGGIAFE